jgi:hypothetical protein
MIRAARRDYLLLVVPEVPGVESRKPVIQAFGVTLGDGQVSCDALCLERFVPGQELRAELRNRRSEPVIVTLAWAPPTSEAEFDPRRALGGVTIDLVKEA